MHADCSTKMGNCGDSESLSSSSAKLGKRLADNVLSDAEYRSIKDSIPNLSGPDEYSKPSPDYSIAVDDESETIFLTFHMSKFNQGWLLDHDAASYSGNSFVHRPLYDQLRRLLNGGLDGDLARTCHSSPTYRVILSGFGLSGAMAIMYNVWIRETYAGQKSEIPISLQSTANDFADLGSQPMHVIAFSPSRIGDQEFVSYAAEITADPPLIIYNSEHDSFYSVPAGFELTAGDVKFVVDGKILLNNDIAVESNAASRKSSDYWIIRAFNYVYVFVAEFIAWIATGVKRCLSFLFNYNPGVPLSVFCDEEKIATVMKYAYFSRLTYLNRRWLEFNEQLETRSEDLIGKYGRASIFSVVENEAKETACIITVDEAIKELIVAFRGTVSEVNWLSDFDVIMIPWEEQGVGIKVHRGFLNDYLSLAQKLRADLKSALKQYKIDNRWRFVMTGHSLGGALALIATLDIFKSVFQGDASTSLRRPAFRLVTYGQPRVGNGELIQKLASVLPRKEMYLRAVNNADLIPHAIPTHVGYFHGGYELWAHPYDQLCEYPTSDWRIRPHEHENVGSNTLVDYMINDHRFFLNLGVSGGRYIYNVGKYQYWLGDNTATL